MATRFTQRVLHGCRASRPTRPVQPVCENEYVSPVHLEPNSGASRIKLAFHGADTDSDILAVTSSRGSSREFRRVVQLATGITLGNCACRTCRGEDAREDFRVGVGVGVVEFQLNRSTTLLQRLSSADPWLSGCCLATALYTSLSAAEKPVSALFVDRSDIFLRGNLAP